MTAIRFAVSSMEHTECQSGYHYLDGHFARSYKAKKRGCMFS